MTIKVEVDWNRDGDYSDTGEDVTSRVRREGGITLDYGRDQVTALAPTIAGRGAITLDNSSRDYSPRNQASPLYGQLKPARPVKITRSLTGGGEGDTYLSDTYDSDVYGSPAGYTLFVGHTDDSPINPDINAKSVTLSLLDSLADFRGHNITTELYSGIRTDQAIDYILDACGWTGARYLDPGATVIRWWWEDNTDALTAMEKVVRSEGPPALLSVEVDGGIVFRNRHHRLMSTASITSQDRWTDVNGGGTIMQTPFSYDEAWKNVINSATVDVDVRAGGPLDVVWTSDATITLSAGEQRIITASGSDPFLAAREPDVDVDFTALSGSVTATLTRTSGASVGIVLTAVGSAAVITDLRLRGRPIRTTYTMQATASDVASIDEYGPRAYPDDLPWCNIYDAQAILDIAVAMRAQPLPILSTRFLCGIDTVKSAAVLSRNLSDRVTVAETETLLDDDFFIESIQHTLTGEHDHAVVFGLEAAPGQIDPPLRFDTASQGFDQGKFSDGLSQLVETPQTLPVFQFDAALQGFDDGNFASGLDAWGGLFLLDTPGHGFDQALFAQ